MDRGIKAAMFRHSGSDTQRWRSIWGRYQNKRRFSVTPLPRDKAGTPRTGGPTPTVPAEVYRAYSVDRPYQEPPKMPVPYTTLAETFSYGI